MNKELNIGDYVRDEKGNIDKLIDIRETTEYAPISAGAVSFHYTEKVFEKDRIKNQIIKSSPNIIGLIEVGDYVNGSRVIEVNKDKEAGYVSVEYSILGKDEIMLALLYDEDSIKTIVTKEQFSQIEYKIGDKE